MKQLDQNHTPIQNNSQKQVSENRKDVRIPISDNETLKLALVVDNKRTAVEAVNISKKGLSFKTSEQYGLRTSDPIIVHLYFYDTVIIPYHLTVKYVDDCRIGAAFSDDNTSSSLVAFKNFVHTRQNAA